MKYVISVEETVKKINGYTIEVNSEREAEELLDSIEWDINDSDHPSDIFEIIQNAGYEIIEYCDGAEDCEYELL